VGRILAKAILCTVAGIVAWMLTAGAFPQDFVPGDLAWARAELIFMSLLMLFIAGTAGLYQGLQQGGKQNIILSVGISIVFGGMAGMLGYSIGGVIARAVFGPEVFMGEGFSVLRIFARTIAIGFLGAGLGVGIGASLRSVRGAVSGLVGGLAGGMLAGFLFDFLGQAASGFILAAQQGNEVGGPSRGLSAALLGFGVGLFTALFEYYSRQAWVRLVLGRNEGKEWAIDANVTRIGKDERAEIPLFADPNLPGLAAVIHKQGGQYVLQDPGSPIGVGLNGVRVASAALNPGDKIQVGSLTLEFLMKAGAARRSAEARSKGVAVGGFAGPVGGAPIGGMPGGIPQGMNQPTMAVPQPQMPQTQMPQAPYGQPTMAVPQPMQTGAQTVMTPGGIQTAGGPNSLIAISGQFSGRRFPLGQPLEIGREASGIALTGDAQASRRHAIISAGPQGLQLQDLGSTNGTFVNGAKVSMTILRQGDVIRIGSSDFRVE
jgi:pSer/pThr/pTyr-binding forkhead associated (FHA) protein